MSHRLTIRFLVVLGAILSCLLCAAAPDQPPPAAASKAGGQTDAEAKAKEIENRVKAMTDAVTGAVDPSGKGTKTMEQLDAERIDIFFKDFHEQHPELGEAAAREQFEKKCFEVSGGRRWKKCAFMLSDLKNKKYWDRVKAIGEEELSLSRAENQKKQDALKSVGQAQQMLDAMEKPAAKDMPKSDMDLLQMLQQSQKPAK